MAKNTPYGVRFNQDVLKKLREKEPDIKPQSALKVYEKAYMELQIFKNFVASELEFVLNKIKK